MPNYILSSSWSHANIRDSIWYAQAEADKATLASNEEIQMGDKVYVITTKKLYIMGNDGNWYEM